MEIFNVGPWELGLILILALIVLGPEGMVKTSRQVARWIAKIIRSPIWKELISTSEEIRTIPQKFVKEANLEETMQEVSKLTRTPLVPDFTEDEEFPAETKPVEELKKESDQSTDKI